MTQQDKEEIIRNIFANGMVAYCSGDYSDDFVKGVALAVKTVESMNVGPDWILCSERLPDEDCVEVLIWYEYYHFKAECIKPEYGIGWTINGSWSGDAGNGRDVRVIAWMPLPEPYGGGEC